MGTATERFEDYVSLIAQQLGHADRVEPFRAHCTGLMLPVPRGEVRSKSVLLAEMDALHYREDDRSRSSEHDVAIGGFDAA